MRRLLIVEDDRDLNRGLQMALQNQELEIATCFTLRQARALLAEETFALILLDINLPDGSGLELLQELRSNCAVPVILLTANDTELDVVTGLEHGADDYITKPFSLAILRARVHAQLRRAASAQKAQPECAMQLGPFRFDFEQMEFYHGGTAVELSKTEQKLLRLLVENRGVTLSRAQLIDRIWTDGADYVDENALSVTVKRLRDKLQAAAYIKTVYGIGYVWKEPVDDCQS